MASPPLQEIVYGLAVASVATTPGICFVAHDRGLRRSRDGGITWQTVFESLDPDVPIPVTSVAVSPGFERDGRVLAGVPGAIIVSHDGGTTWHSTSLPLPMPFISALTLSPGFEHDGTAFAATMQDGVFVTVDHGWSWVAWNLGLLDHSVLSLAASPTFERDQTLFVGTESGIFISSNSGRFWQETTFPSDAAPVLSLVLAPSFADDGLLFAGTDSHGLFAARRPWDSWQALGINEPGAINSVLIAPTFPTAADLLILLDDRLLISRDGGQSWKPCSIADPSGAELSAVLAPWGLDRGSALIVGRMNGHAQRYTLDEE